MHAVWINARKHKAELLERLEGVRRIEPTGQLIDYRGKSNFELGINKGFNQAINQIIEEILK